MLVVRTSGFQSGLYNIGPQFHQDGVVGSVPLHRFHLALTFESFILIIPSSSSAHGPDVTQLIYRGQVLPLILKVKLLNQDNIIFSHFVLASWCQSVQPLKSLAVPSFCFIGHCPSGSNHPSLKIPSWLLVQGAGVSRISALH